MLSFYSVAVTAAGFAACAFLHSLLAHRSVKRFLFGRWPALESYYRAGYTLLSLLTFGAWYLYAPFPEGVWYRVPFPYFLPLRLVQAAGLAGFVLSLRAVNLAAFIGMEQLASPGSPEEGPEELVTDGLYRHVRHPLYTATVAVLLFNPVMSWKLALITLLVILYSWIGSVYEERNLVARYGRAYEEYRRKVPRFIPKIPLF